MTRFAERTAFVTGGTTGIGFATAQALIAEGARVVVTGQDAGRVAEAGRKLGNQALAVTADVTSAEAMEAAVAKAVAAFGTIDVVFANAGIALGGPAGDTPTDVVERMLATNISGVLNTVRAVLPHLAEGASVVLNASSVATKTVAGVGVYSATKAAVLSLGKTLAVELAPRGIRVNMVSPGMTETPILGKFGMPPEAQAAMLEGVKAALPAGRVAQPDEIAGAVLFLSDRRSGYVTGSNLIIDGGQNVA
ncbi:SDR family oxidoreductase [Tabrizicola sp.]|uniref:SDR family oxidoreductase n=1 Tax=Tabrizicola sp. TaxID=2005166 RepID=UPI003F377354